jgi:3-isopropylmalate/(R)-2-methylmalate dehydratase large subunit
MLREMGYEHVAAPDRVFVTIDHTTFSDDPRKISAHKFIREDVRREKIQWFLDIGRTGISHNAPLEIGVVRPGMLVLACDTRAPALGCAGAISIALGLGLTTVYALGKTWLRVPQTIRVEITGNLRPGVMSRDIAQWIAHQIGPERADYRCIEFHGNVVENLSMDGRHTLCNAMVDLGVKTAVCAPSLEGKAELLSDSDAQYADRVQLNISDLEPQISVPPDPENVVPLSSMLGVKITSAFIGSCIGGKLEDMRAAANVLAGRKVHRDVRLIVIPATQAVYQAALREGLILSFTEAGASINAGVCGPCYGTLAALGDTDVAICTATRNDKGRMGSEQAQIYIANPAVVAASAVAGCIADPRCFQCA